MTNDKKWGIETLAIQGGYQQGSSNQACVLPIYQSTAYVFEDADHAARLFNLEEAGNIYSRIMNPTVTALEEKIASLDGGIGALAVSSGHAAITLAILNLTKNGDHIISASTIYGGTYNLFNVTLRKLGIDTSFVNIEDIQQVEQAIKENTKAIFVETIGNPNLNIANIKKIKKIAEENHIPLIVDNTFATPYLCRPIEHGADIVIYSATKYISGHGNSMGGLIVDSGNFDWSKTNKFLEFVEPDPSYHGISFTETFGKAAFIARVRTNLLRDIGACISPFNAFLINLGLETLPLRMERHSKNALEVAKFLEKHPCVAWVSYPQLSTHPSNSLVDTYLPRGCSGILTFGIKGGATAGKAFINGLKMIKIVANVGDTRTMVIHPASTTHRQLDENQQKNSGVLPELIRVSVGIEAVEDIINDIDQALYLASK